MTITKRLPVGFLCIFGATTALFSAAIWCQWDNLKSIHEERQISTINRFATNLDSFFATQAMVLSFIEQHILSGNEPYDAEKVTSEFEKVLNANIDISMMGIFNTEGVPELVVPQRAPGVTLNLLDNPNTRDSFINTLNNYHMTLGRTYRIDGKLMIPLRKALRTETGEATAIISLGLKINHARLFTNTQHYASYNTVTLLRDDGYRQFLSSNVDYPSAYSKKPLVYAGNTTNAVLAVENIANNYPYDKNSLIPHLYYTDNAQVVTARLEKYGLWLKSSILKRDIMALFLTPFLVQLSLYMALNIVALCIIRLLATKQRQRDEDLFYQAHHDELTRLPNRQFLLHNIPKWMNSKASGFSMVLINIDHFKLINDSYGHISGDRVLKEVAYRLKKIKSKGDLLIRYAGDEFILLTPVIHSSQLRHKSSLILSAMALPYAIGENNICLGGSIGIAKAPEHGETFTQLLRAANIAMYKSKKQGNKASVFLFSMEESYMHRLVVEERLRIATEREAFDVVYQPQFDANSHFYGVESLVRWHDEKLGAIGPDKFIPIAEYCGLMPKIGQYILETSLKQLSTLQKELSTTFQMAINISAQQLCHVEFFEILRTAISLNNIEPSRITIEITESLFIDDINDVIPLLNQLRTEGVCISLDDFGTGYSSLSMLRTLPIDELKIDKSFVADIFEDIVSLKMVESIISIGKNLNLTILAEGIELPEQLIKLTEVGCDLFQGYHFSKPLSLTDLYDYISHRKLTAYQPNLKLTVL